MFSAVRFASTHRCIIRHLQVTDLLHEGRSVGAWHGIAHRKVLDGGCQVELSSAEARDQELFNLLRSAEERKRRAATAMNERSSRAHAVLIFRLVQRDAQDGAEDTETTMCMADLGGSEQVRPPSILQAPCYSNTDSGRAVARGGDGPR